MLVKVVFVMNFVVGGIILTGFWSSMESGRLTIDGWQEMAAANFLVGCLALIVEEWLCRKRRSQPNGRTLLLRSALMHTVYVALAFELNIAMIRLRGVHLVHGFTYGPHLTAVLQSFRALAFTLPSAIVITVPAGLLVGLANGLLLRARDDDATPGLRRSAQVLIVLAILLMAVASYQWVHGWRVMARTLAAAQRALHELPVPPHTVLVYREYKGCIPCRDARTAAVYATDLSPEEVCEAYRSHLSRPRWRPSLDGCRRRCASGEVESAQFHLRQPPVCASQGAAAILTASRSSRKGPYFMGLSHDGERKAIPRAKATGATFSSIEILWIENKATHDRLCPPDASGGCKASNSWFFPNR